MHVYSYTSSFSPIVVTEMASVACQGIPTVFHQPNVVNIDALASYFTRCRSLLSRSYLSISFFFFKFYRYGRPGQVNIETGWYSDIFWIFHACSSIMERLCIFLKVLLFYVIDSNKNWKMYHLASVSPTMNNNTAPCISLFSKFWLNSFFLWIANWQSSRV